MIQIAIPILMWVFSSIDIMLALKKADEGENKKAILYGFCGGVGFCAAPLLYLLLHN